MRHVVVTMFLLLLLLTMTVGHEAPERSPPVRCTWDAPVEGSLPVEYELQIQEVGVAEGLDSTYVVPHQGGAERGEQEFFFLDGQEGNHYRARVRARDAQGRYGPWSEWSPDWWFEGDDP